MKKLDFTIEWCPECEQESPIHSTGVTPCVHCGNYLLPCSTCPEEDCLLCPYEREFGVVYHAPLTKEEIDFALANC